MPVNQHTGISCAIVTNDDPSQSAPYPEFKPQSEFLVSTGTRQETVFIESTVGASFAVHLEIGNFKDPSSLRPDLTIYTSMDGVKVGLYRHHHASSSRIRLAAVLSRDLQSVRNYQFAPIALVDADDDTLDLSARVKLDSELCNDEEVIKNLGSIQINLFRCRLGRKVPRSIGSSTETRTANQMKFSERCKKAALSNTAGLSDEAVPNTRPNLWEQLIELEEPHPFLQFVFKYRSRALLEAEGIILPPLPTPALHSLPEPPAVPHATSPQASGSKPKLKQDPGSSGQGSNSNILEINSDDELEEKPKPKVETPTRSIKEEDEKVRIKKRERTAACSTSAGTRADDQILIVDNDDEEDIKAIKRIRNRRKSALIDLTKD